MNLASPSSASPLTFSILLRRGPAYPWALKQALDFALAGAAFGHAVTLIVLDEAIHYFTDAGQAVCDEHAFSALLGQLPLFDIDPIWVYQGAGFDGSSEGQTLTLDMLKGANLKPLTAEALAMHLEPPHHTLVF